MQSDTLLRLRSSGPGLPGPYLEESLAGYRVLDYNPKASLHILLAIGGERKASFFSHRTMANSISIWQLNRNCVVLDSELHQSDGGVLPRIRGGPIPGHYCHHLLRTIRGSARHIAYMFYSKILSCFAHISVIFVQDLGGICSTVELLCLWALYTDGDGRQGAFPVVLVQDQPLSLEQLRFEMTIRLLSMFREQGEELQISAAEVRLLIARTFKFYSMSSEEQLPQLFDLAAEQARGQASRGVRLLAAHRKTLLRRAISQFAQTPYRSVQLIDLSRQNRPVPSNMQQYIIDRISLSKNDSMNICITSIASALALDAAVGGGHCFPATELFERLYTETISACERETDKPGLTQDVRALFQTIMLSVQGFAPALAVENLNRARSWWEEHLVTSATSSCAICLLRTADFTLDCRHSFCSSCITKFSKEANVWNFAPLTCILCQKPNKTWVSIQPATAGTRTFELGGGVAGKIIEFIRATQMFGGLKHIPIHEQFDGVQATDAGIFFLLTLFRERWSLRDCSYQASRVTQYKKRKGTISFGKNLEWDLSRLVEEPGKYRIGDTSSKKHSRSNWVGTSSSGGLVVRYSGAGKIPVNVADISSALVAALFYPELVNKPLFYSSPELCELNILCRIAPSANFVDFLLFLRRNRATVVYRCSEDRAYRTSLCTDSVIAACQNGHAFKRPILVEAISPQSFVQVSLESHPLYGSKLSNISSCPYKLQDLIADQGLDCPFTGAIPHQHGEAFDVMGEVDRIIDTLDEEL